MCYNKDVSRANFFINIVTTSIQFSLSGDVASHKTCATFFFFVGLMQLYDWYFWDHNGKTKGNSIVTKIAMITNHLQPIVLGALVFVRMPDLHPLSRIMLAVYTPTAVVYTAWLWNKVDYTVTNPTTKLLYWKWNDQKFGSVFYSLFLATFTTIMFENFPVPLNYALVGINLVSFVLGMYKTHYVGERWCEFACYVPLLLMSLKF
ncbi:hypothetical protein HDU98_009806 [Podochytrium sp. JEL0797]|nr:hypothetical protein HDU98_009806 [Podochytrium sp. JEL0797]